MQNIALAGNPNVGKSTVFNALTGLSQHTGNWSGKTVSCAEGKYTYKDKTYVITDLPGTYSLVPHSAEEEVAGDFICFGKADGIVVVCDACCLSRNMGLVLQCLEITQNVIVCVNLMDEAEKKKIKIDFPLIRKRLNVPVIPICARSEKGLESLKKAVSQINRTKNREEFKIEYDAFIEEAVSNIEKLLKDIETEGISKRFIALKLLTKDEKFIKSFASFTKTDLAANEISSKVDVERSLLFKKGYTDESLEYMIASSVILKAEEICQNAVVFDNTVYKRDRKIDRILLGKSTGIPVMLCLLCLIFYITVVGANYPSVLISDFLFGVLGRLYDFLSQTIVPQFIVDTVVLGIFRVVAWVVSVMLPPMAIFFPLFTILEDLGYLPRIAFNLDKVFQKCNACGKQALTMW